MFRKRRRRSAGNLNVRAAIHIFGRDIRPPAGDFYFPRTSPIFTDKVDFPRSFSIVLVAVSNFRRNAQRSAEDSGFQPQFSIFGGCFECSAELLKIRRQFRFFPKLNFLPAERNRKPQKKRNPARVLNCLRIGRIPFISGCALRLMFRAIALTLRARLHSQPLMQAN
jgi:hypothetical protein